MSDIEWNPGKIMGLSGYYWKTCALHAGVKLDIFTAVPDEGASGKKIAEKINADQDAAERLLNALAALGLLEKKEGLFFNAGAAKKFLSKDSNSYIGFMILHHHYLVESWSKLDKAVASGKPVRDPSLDDDDKRGAFLMGMFNTASVVAPNLAGQFDLSGCGSLLDLGGGPGTYAIHFCLQNAGLKASIYDLAETRPFAERMIEKFGLTDRISFIKGDFVSGELPGKYDVIWMSHILHGEGPETCRDIIKKAANILNPGGMIMIHEFILKESRDSPLFPALFSLNMLLETGSGRAYSEKELAEMLEGAGLTNVRRSSFRGVNDSGVMIGKKTIGHKEVDK